MSDTEDAPPFMIKLSTRYGRCLVANRDISAGKLIFKEDPLFLCNAFDHYEETFTCANCFRVLNGEPHSICDICGWKFCSWYCTRDPTHRKDECKIFALPEVLPCPVSPHLEDIFLLLYRCFVLKGLDEPKWNQIINLASTLGKEDPHFNAYLDEVSEQALTFLRGSFGMKITQDSIKTILRIFKLNSFTFTTTTQKFTAIFGTCSLLAHSCAPNAVSVLHGKSKKDWAVAIYSRVDIKEGDMVTIAYDEESMWRGTYERRQSIFDQFRFCCACVRCLDPTELGTNYCSLKCPRCINGYMLPPIASGSLSSPSYVSAQSLYRCDKCTFSYPSQKAERIEQIVLQKILALEDKAEIHEINVLDHLILNATSEYKLHRNHHLVIGACTRWLTLQDFDVLLRQNRTSIALYEKILDRADRVRSIAYAFLLPVTIVEMEAMMSSTIIRFNFQSRDHISIVRDIDDLDGKIAVLEKIIKHLRLGLGVAEQMLFDRELGCTLRDMRKRFNIWSEILALSHTTRSWKGSGKVWKKPLPPPRR